MKNKMFQNSYTVFLSIVLIILSIVSNNTMYIEAAGGDLSVKKVGSSYKTTKNTDLKAYKQFIQSGKYKKDFSEYIPDATTMKGYWYAILDINQDGIYELILARKSKMGYAVLYEYFPEKKKIKAMNCIDGLVFDNFTYFNEECLLEEGGFHRVTEYEYFYKFTLKGLKWHHTVWKDDTDYGYEDKNKQYVITKEQFDGMNYTQGEKIKFYSVKKSKNKKLKISI